jgi:ParB-like chromosome segregation protein Spo0J
VPRFAVRILPVSRLKPARYNPRKPLMPRSRAYRKLRASIERFGLVEPLVWNATTGRLVGGHARLRILKDLGITDVPVSVVRLTPDREKALNVVLNNLEAQGRYDPKKLAGVLESLAGLPALKDSGFDDATLRTLRFAPAALPPAEVEPNRVDVTLEIPAALFETVEPKLDRLVREYDLVTHVVRTTGQEKRQPQRRRERRGSQRMNGSNC